MSTEKNDALAPAEPSAIAEYEVYDAETAKQEMADAQRGKTDFYEFVVGDNRGRIPPPLKGKKSPFKVTFQHVIQFGDQKLFFNCPRKMENKPCPACEQADKLCASKNPADQERAKEWWSKRRVLCNWIPFEGESRVEVARIGKTIHDAFLELRQDPNFGDFTHPQTGYDVIVKRKGKGKNDTEYKVFPCRPSALKDMKLIGQQKDLDQLAVCLSYDAILAKFKVAKEAAAGGGEKPVNGESNGKSHRRERTVADEEDAEIVSNDKDDDDPIPF